MVRTPTSKASAGDSLIQVRLPGGLWSYDPKKPLGAPGGFGAVFAGKGAANEPIAVKRLHIDAAQAAHRELKVAAELAGREFKHVMPVFDAGQDSESDGYFVIMPVAEQSLQDQLDAKGPMAEADAAAVLRQVAAGLTELPQIVHRDLKPANVLLLGGSWRIADFGIARFVEDSTSARTLKDCLSPLYAAPEQWKFERATPATDVYALGCIAYALLAGAPPFDGSPSQLQDKHLHATPPELGKCSPQMRTLLAMMLRKEPEARPSLARVLSILDQQQQGAQPATDRALDSLALAAATHEKKQAEAAAARERDKSAQAKRDALAAEAKRTLGSIFDELANRITQSVPNASVTKSGSSMYIRVGPATLELDLGLRDGALAEDAFPRSKWDVICGAVIEVNQTAPPHKRAANLWYTRQGNRAADYRWYEVGYAGNPLTQRGFEFEPAAVTAERADRAHWAGMDVVQVAYQPTPIDDENVEAFCQRWTHILAEACAGRLQNVPRALPP